MFTYSNTRYRLSQFTPEATDCKKSRPNTFTCMNLSQTDWLLFPIHLNRCGGFLRKGFIPGTKAKMEKLKSEMRQFQINIYKMTYR